MTVDPQTVAERQTLFEVARKLIAPIIEEHGLEEYRTGSPFSVGAVYTPVDQHLTHVIELARWLGGLDE